MEEFRKYNRINRLNKRVIHSNYFWWVSSDSYEWFKSKMLIVIGEKNLRVDIKDQLCTNLLVGDPVVMVRHPLHLHMCQI
jgi:hypothetical protein